MLDVCNRELAKVTEADDFIVSDKLISLLMAQVSENKHLHAVFADLFDSDGSEIYLKPAQDYVALHQPLNFYTVVEAARRSRYRLSPDGSCQRQREAVWCGCQPEEVAEPELC